MRLKIYNALVNQNPGICHRYHDYHDKATGIRKLLSWFYLFWLNFAYHVLGIKRIGEIPGLEVYERITPPVGVSESDLHLKNYPYLSVEGFWEKVKPYETVSFDIFDTLIFRPFSDPKDAFYLMGEKLQLMDFRNQRIKAEARARQKCMELNGHTEINLKDIWTELNAETGWDIEEGIKTECEVERNICKANPFMKALWDKLLMEGKTIIITSDMYLPSEVLAQILEGHGFTGYKKLYVSNEYGKNKASGSLYEVVKKDFPSIVHIGDNVHSDISNCEKAGIKAIYYPNVNDIGNEFRAKDMSYIAGSAYRGIVNSHIYNGHSTFTREYEYGFIYGGLFVTGYCNFIHRQYVNRGLDKVLFLSRDGDILKKVYDDMFPNDVAVYAYWSRKAATKLMAEFDRHDYFRRFIDHKVGSGCTIKEALQSMELDSLSGKITEVGIGPEEQLVRKNGDALRKVIEENWEVALSEYKGQQEAAKKYYSEILGGCNRVAAVDIGWAGSGWAALSYLTEKVWNIPCTLFGIIAGTNTPVIPGADGSEQFLQSGRLISYMYSSANNREIWKKHNPNINHNVYWELLLSSPTPQFKGFYENDELRFGEEEFNIEGMREIQRGILDFSHLYCNCFKDYGYMKRISGRDAYAPMLSLYEEGSEYLKSIDKLFQFELGVN